MSDESPTYSVKEAVALLGKSEATIRRWISSGKLRAVERPIPGGKEWRITLPTVDGDTLTGDDQPPTTDDGEPITDDGEAPTSEDRRLVLVRPLIAAMERERAEERAQFVAALAQAQQAAGFWQGMALALALHEAAPDEDTSGTVGASDAAQTRWARFKAWLGGRGDEGATS
jgi:excisionase family DNA binding protein